MKRIVALFLTLVLSGTVVFATTETPAVPVELVDGDNIKITGTLPIERVKQVTIQVIKPNRSLTELYDAQNPAGFTDIIAYHGQVESNASGSYEFNFVIKGDPNTYNYFITSTNYSVADNFVYYGSNYNNYIVGQINQNRANTTMVKGLVTDNYSNININAPVYESLLTALPAKVDDVFTNLTLFSDAADVSALSTQLNQAAALVFINQETTKDGMGTAIGNYAAALGTAQISSYDVYANILNTVENAFIKDKILNNVVLGRTYTTVSSFNDKFREEVMLNTFNDIATWNEMKSFLEKTNDVTLIDFTECNSLNYPENVYLALLSETVTAVEQIDDKFVNAVNAQKLSENGNQNQGSPSPGPGSPAPGNNQGGGLGPSINNTLRGDTAKEDGKFSDLSGYKWAEEDIYFLKEKGIIAGMTDTEFAPAAQITREQFIKLLVLTAGIENDSNSKNFSDVPSGSWYEPYVNMGVAAGIIQGTGDGKFGVGSQIKREDMAVMVYRIAKPSLHKLSDNGKKEFKDENIISEYALEAVEELAKYGMLLGTSESEFDPKSNVTRAQAAVLLRRVYNLLAEGA